MRLLDKTGEVMINNFGSQVKIIKYINNKNIVVEFNNGYICKSNYSNFTKKHIKSPYCKTVFKNGYLGEGKYVVSDEGIHTKQYVYWSSMLRRCYSDRYKKLFPTYNECVVCEEWFNFQNFGKWFDENYYEVDKASIMNLDKDILNKGNKIYSPENCVFVPQYINEIFTQHTAKRGKYPIGVRLEKGNKFRAVCSKYGKEVHLGIFNTPKEAFDKYKSEKENYVKEVADNHKNKIPTELYKAMYKWKVEITD